MNGRANQKVARFVLYAVIVLGTAWATMTIVGWFANGAANAIT